jgi:hypothetical protein
MARHGQQVIASLSLGMAGKRRLAKVSRRNRIRRPFLQLLKFRREEERIATNVRLNYLHCHHIIWISTCDHWPTRMDDPMASHMDILFADVWNDNTPAAGLQTRATPRARVIRARQGQAEGSKNLARRLEASAGCCARRALSRDSNESKGDSNAVQPPRAVIRACQSVVCAIRPGRTAASA